MGELEKMTTVSKGDPKLELESSLMNLKDPFLELMKLEARLLRIERKELRPSDTIESLKASFTEVNKKIESVNKNVDKETIIAIQSELETIRKLIIELSGKIQEEIDSWKDRYGM